MAKYTLSKQDKDCNTRFLERDGFTAACPYHIIHDEKGVPSDASCGDWCALFDAQTMKEGQGAVAHDKTIVYLLCGSGNAAYTIEGE